MVLIEELTQVVPVRPGRSLFVRKLLIGSGHSDVVSDGLAGGKSSIDSPPTVTNETQSRSPPRRLQLVCLHGTCASEQQFQPLLEAIDKLLALDNEKDKTRIQVSCLLFDNVGCGQSPASSEWNAYENDEIRADLAAVLTQYAQPDSPTIVMGHSYAPNIFIPLLHDDKNTTNASKKLLPHLMGCILLSTAVKSPLLPLPDGGHIIMRLPVRILTCLQRQLTESFLQMAIHNDHVALKNAIRSASNGNNMRVARMYHRNHQWCVSPALLQATLDDVPTLIVHGANDGLVPIECGEQLHRLLLDVSKLSKSSTASASTSPSTLIVLERTSHMVMLEQPEQTARAIVNYLHQTLARK